MGSTKRDESDFFKQAIEGKKILIADPSLTARACVSRVLSDLGVRSYQILLANTFDSAAEVIQTQRPSIIIAEYELGRRSGLELLDLEAVRSAEKMTFVVLLSNHSATASARIAESSAAGVLQKPFTPEEIRISILQIIAGVVLGENQKSIQLELLQQQRLQYRAMVGIYEDHLREGRNAEAYDLARKISEYFPANPKRLVEVLRLAVKTGNFSDIDDLYRIYLSLEERTEEVVSHVSAALVVAGKYALRTKTASQAVDLFQKAAVTSGGKPGLLKEIVQSLIDANQVTDADHFLKRFSKEAQKSNDYLLLDFQLANLAYSAAQVLQRGQELRKNLVGDLRFYEIMIARALECGLKVAAEKLVLEAKTRFPDRQARFEKMLISVKNLA